MSKRTDYLDQMKMCIFNNNCTARNNECLCQRYYMQGIQNQYIAMQEFIRNRQYQERNCSKTPCSISNLCAFMMDVLQKLHSQDKKYLVLWSSLILLFSVLVWILSYATGMDYIYARGTQHKCYGEYGCFSNEAPFSHLPLPWSLEQINVTFYLVSKSATSSSEILLMSSDSLLSSFDRSKDTKLLIHGFRCRQPYTSQLRDALAQKNQWNVIFVNWFGGADLDLHQYPAAVSNTRLVGAVTARWLQMLQEMYSYPTSRVHCLGISLGAHTCGFVGKHLTTRGSSLRRITGLDPAGPFFMDQPVSGRLDSSDAQFVDVIHTDVSNAWYWFNMGLQQPVGHVDFYPNGGRQQTSCPTILDIWSVSLAYWIGCSHMRSIELYMASLNPRCSFGALPCHTLHSALQGSCQLDSKHRVQNVQSLGEDSISYSGRGIFYLETEAWPPKCLE